MKKLHLSFLLLLVAAANLRSQALNPALLGNPPVDAWPTYHGDYTGRHYSPLTQINQSNIKNLGLAWVSRPDKSAAGAMIGGEGPEAVNIVGAHSGGMIKATPLSVNGVLYFSVPDHAWAVDARTGKEIWHYFWKTRGGDHIGNRGVGMYGSWLFFEVPDGYIVSLDAATGKERWHKKIAEMREEYFTTTAPTIIRNHVLVGMGGDALDVPGWLESRDPETGDIQWKWFTTPRPGQPGAETWPDAYSMEHGGGMPWTPITYDQELNLIYVPTGNPNPVQIGDSRKGNNLWTASIVALNADTGKMVWYFQCSPHDTHDWDATQVPVLFEATIDGQPRKLIAQASRNGMFFVLDRVTGKNIVSAPFIESANWSKGFDAKGQPIPNPDKESQYPGTLVSPNNGGAANWAPPTFSPDTGLFYLNASEGYSMFYRTELDGPPVGGAGHTEHGTGGLGTFLRALDPKTGKIKWSRKYPGTEWDPPRPEHLGGLLSTAGKLLFAGSPAGDLVAYDPETGKPLWHVNLGAEISNTPITYMLDGRQYLVVAANDNLFAFFIRE